MTSCWLSAPKPDAITALKHSALALDIYTWLAHRLCRVPKAEGVKLSWENLRDQFGQEYSTSKNFKHEFRDMLKQVRIVYPDARLEETPGGLNAFRIHKSDLELRPVWHHKEDRVKAHILVCFLAYVLWKTLGRWCSQAGRGDEPRKVIDELSRIRLVDVVMKTDTGEELRRRCVGQLDEHQAILLQRLGLTLPQGFEVTPEPDANVVRT